MNRIIIGNDHGGYALKQEVVTYLNNNGIDTINIGSDQAEIVRYPHYAAKVAGAVSRGECGRGILICSTGIGMSMIANKFPGVRASMVTDTYMAKMTRLHNNSNILCLGGKITGVNLALDILETWLHTGYEGGRHDISLGLIAEAEQTQMTGAYWEPVMEETAHA